MKKIESIFNLDDPEVREKYFKIHRHYTPDNIATIRSMCDWINDKDLFWLHELRDHFGVTDTSNNNKGMQIVRGLTKELKEKNIIQCSEKRGAFRQYILMRKFTFEELIIGK